MKRIISIFSIILLTTICHSCKPAEYDFFASLYGIVSDTETGDPLGNASIVLSPGGKTQTTGNDGRFEFSDLDPMQYTITVQKPGYKTNRKTVTTVMGEKTEVNSSLTKN